MNATVAMQVEKTAKLGRQQELVKGWMKEQVTSIVCTDSCIFSNPLMGMNMLDIL